MARLATYEIRRFQVWQALMESGQALVEPLLESLPSVPLPLPLGAVLDWVVLGVLGDLSLAMANNT